MKEKIILSTIVLTILSLVVFVSAVNPPSLPEKTTKDIPGYGSITADYEEVTVNVANGWNLVRGLANPDWITGGDLSKDQIKAIYGLDPTTKEYIRFYPENPDLKNTNIGMDYLVGNTLFWIYVEDDSDNAVSMTYPTFELFPVENRQLFSGWNFVVITPEMIGKDLEGIKGNCEVDKVYRFDVWQQAFNNVQNDFDQLLRYEDNVNYGFLMKVKEDCVLGVEGDEIAVPEIPENIMECEDSDLMVIDQKGTVTNELDTKTDYCVSNTTLREYSCDYTTGQIEYNDFDCSERGFTSCNNGICVN